MLAFFRFHHNYLFLVKNKKLNSKVFITIIVQK